MIPCYQVAGLCLHLRFIVVISLILLFCQVQPNAQSLWDGLNKKASEKALTAPNRIGKNCQSRIYPDTLSIFTPNPSNNIGKAEKSSDVTISFSVDSKRIRNFYQEGPQQVRIHIPVMPDLGFDLLLYRTKLLGSDYQMILKGTTKEKITLDAPKFYHGIIEGLVNSIVTLTLMDDHFVIHLHYGTDNRTIASDPVKPFIYTLRQNEDHQKSSKSMCSTEDLRYFVDKDKPHHSNPSSQQKSTRCIGIYLETDKFTFDAFNQDVITLQNYFLALFNEVAALYTNENVSIELTQLVIPTTSTQDWSAPETSINNLLERFGEEIQDNYTGRLGHFITLRNFGGGLGWIDVLCNNYSTFWADWDGDGVQELHHYGPYAVSTGLSGQVVPIPTYSYDVAVITHEIGHNLGSFHTHACAWGPNNQAIDDCTTLEGNCTLINTPPLEEDIGTIMSYCHTTPHGIDFTKGFGTLPGDLIRNKINNAICNLSCDENQLYGCTDPNYHNYNPSASIDDGSCSGTCSDSIRNGDETGVDCGGILCLPCEVTCNDHSIRITLRFDNHPEETSWEMVDSLTNAIIASGGPYSGFPDGSTEVIDLCLTDGSYIFTVLDSWGDGMCCSSGNGYFLVTSTNQDTIAHGGQFSSSLSTGFNLLSDPCENILMVSGNLTGTYESAQMIMSSGPTNLLSSSTFRAPVIEIYEDFQVPSGTSFNVQNEGCNN